MLRKIEYLDGTITYELQYKRVKNINLRIRPDKTVCVSAGKRVPIGIIDGFVLSKAEFIISAINRYDEMSANRKRYFEDKELMDFVTEFCRRIYPYYEKKGIYYPAIRFRRMVSRWGSCNPKKSVVTFNLYLAYAPKECVEYVVYQEFTHFLRTDHSKHFYEELEKVCPDWREKRLMLKNVAIDRFEGDFNG